MLGQFPTSWRVRSMTREADIYLGFGVRVEAQAALAEANSAQAPAGVRPAVLTQPSDDPQCHWQLPPDGPPARAIRF